MQFFIELDKQGMSYVGGQTISGKVVVDMESDDVITGLFLRCCGFAEARWSETNTERPVDNLDVHILNEKYFTGREEYFEFKQYLLGHHDGPSQRLAPGRHEYHFNHLVLPLGIPNSFKGRHGVVEYFIEAKIIRPNTFDYDTKIMFDVSGLVNLNAFPKAANRVEIRKEKSLTKGCFCFGKGNPFGFSLKMFRAGFLLGETIEFTANLYNMTSFSLSKTTVSLRQVSRYNTELKSVVDFVKIAEVDAPDVEPGTTKIWEEKLIVPLEIPPSKLGGCDIIDLDYEILMVVHASNAMELSGTIPVIIGTTPFQYHLIQESSTLSLAGSNLSTEQGVLKSGNPSTSSAPSVTATDQDVRVHWTESDKGKEK